MKNFFAAPVLACLLLCWVNPAAAQPASRPTPPATKPGSTQQAEGAGLSFKVKAWFKKERRGDGAPTLHFRYILQNKTDEPIYLNNYNRPVRLARLGPRRAFRVTRHRRRPHRLRQPRPSDIVVLAPRSKKVIKDWQWCCSFELPHEDPAHYQRYRLRRPATVTLRYCLSSGSNQRLVRHLPPGKKFWSGRLCARPVRVRLHARGQ